MVDLGQMIMVMLQNYYCYQNFYSNSSFDKNNGNVLETTSSDGTQSDDTTTEYIKEPTTTSPNFNFLDFLKTREYWGGGELNSSVVPKLDMPIKRIIIAHTRGQFCANEVK